MCGLKVKKKKRAYCVVFINTGQFSVKELATYDNPLHSVSALNFAKALFKDIITFDFLVQVFKTTVMPCDSTPDDYINSDIHRLKIEVH